MSGREGAPVAVSTYLSLARRTPAGVHVRLHLPRGLGDGPVRVRLTRDGATAEAEATTERLADAEVLVRADVDLPGRTAGTWRVALVPGSGPAEPVDAFVLLHPGSPVALVPGSPTGRRLQPPARRAPAAASRSLPFADRAPELRRRALATAGRTVDRILVVLPPDRAARTRRGIRRWAHRHLVR